MHEHRWRLQYAFGNIDRYRCGCGAWGWKARHTKYAVRPYSGGRTFDDNDGENVTIWPATDWGGRIAKLPTLDRYDGEAL